MAKIGIDFGTSYSVASYIDAQTGEAKPIRINGLEKIPTMLYFSNDSANPLVGQVAYENMMLVRTRIHQKKWMRFCLESLPI